MHMNTHTQSAVGPNLLCFSKPSANMTPCAKKPVKLQFPCSYSDVPDPESLWLMQTCIHVHINGLVWVIEVNVMGSVTSPCHPKRQFAGVALLSALISRFMNSVYSSALPLHSSSSKVPLTFGLFSHFPPPYFFSPLVWVFFRWVFAALAPMGAVSSHWAVLAVLGTDGSMLWVCLTPGQAGSIENICLRPGLHKLRWHCLHPTRDNKNSYPEECGRFT